jgi:hypothetical protein
MLNEEMVKAEIVKFCQKELGKDLKDIEVEERGNLFWVRMGDSYARIERRHLDDYMHGDRDGSGKAGLLMALINARRK